VSSTCDSRVGGHRGVDWGPAKESPIKAHVELVDMAPWQATLGALYVSLTTALPPTLYIPVPPAPLATADSLAYTFTQADALATSHPRPRPAVPLLGATCIQPASLRWPRGRRRSIEVHGHDIRGPGLDGRVRPWCERGSPARPRRAPIPRPPEGRGRRGGAG
jgi:hypothetical protein